MGLETAVERRAVGPDLGDHRAAGVGQLHVEKALAVAVLAQLLLGEEREPLDVVAGFPGADRGVAYGLRHGAFHIVCLSSGATDQDGHGTGHASRLRVRHRTPLFLSLLLLLSFVSPARPRAARERSHALARARARLPPGRPGLLLTAEQRTELRGFNPEARARWIAGVPRQGPAPGDQGQRAARGDRPPPAAGRRPVPLAAGRAGAAHLPQRPARGPAGGRLRRGVPSARDLDLQARGPGRTASRCVHRLVVFTAGKGEPYRLWLPSDAKAELYTPLMEYWLQQWEELRGQHLGGALRPPELQGGEEGRRGDRRPRPHRRHGLRGEEPRIRPHDNSDFLRPPKDLAEWAREAAATEVPNAGARAQGGLGRGALPRARGAARWSPARWCSCRRTPATSRRPDAKPMVRLTVEGMVEQQGKSFEEFRMRFLQPAPKPGEPMVLAIDRRPALEGELHPAAEDHGRRRRRRGAAGARLPGAERSRPRSRWSPARREPPPRHGELVPVKTAAGADSLLLLPPTDDVLIGLWRADAIVTGSRIEKVAFLVDGKTQLTTAARRTPPRCGCRSFPTEQTIRAEGYDAEGKLVASDEVIVNQPKGAFNVRIVSPSKGTRAPGEQGRGEGRGGDPRRPPTQVDGVQGQRPGRRLADQAPLAGRGAGAGGRPGLPDRGGDPRRRQPQPRRCATCGRRRTSPRWTSIWWSSTPR